MEGKSPLVRAVGILSTPQLGWRGSVTSSMQIHDLGNRCNSLHGFI
jgi:hypothetical protein